MESSSTSRTSTHYPDIKQLLIDSDVDEKTSDNIYNDLKKDDINSKEQLLNIWSRDNNKNKYFSLIDDQHFNEIQHHLFPDQQSIPQNQQPQDQPQYSSQHFKSDNRNEIEKINEMMSRICLIRVGSENTFINLGCGVRIGNHLVLTSRHIVKSMDPKYSNTNECIYQIYTHTPTSEWCHSKLLKCSERHDLALLELQNDHYHLDQLPPIPLMSRDNNSESLLLKPLIVLGYPRGRIPHALIKKKHIDSIQTPLPSVDKGYISFVDSKITEVTTIPEIGYSSVIFSEDGHFLGVTKNQYECNPMKYSCESLNILTEWVNQSLKELGKDSIW
ncbi:trypsin-like serine proteases family protein [Tieghemostelium lacteum]|uniref:Trypsin-like serine proteases family protein n=1 Tax=Tieghemostelium lacteum TaxID=361077 RepID=A0A151ZIM1_TIELA|nr:trypsin-like serine proteases family protein [Tieghemostelium lacteum]|eukprot:KYQ93755.1 trypsin-like serine proteases family protein [Tieghemostelium lacteum]